MEIVWETGDRVRETQAQLELSLARDVKDNGKGFHRYIANKRKPRDDVGPLRKETGDLTTLDMKKAEVLNDFCASYSMASASATLLKLRNGNTGAGRPFRHSRRGAGSRLSNETYCAQVQ